MIKLKDLIMEVKPELQVFHFWGHKYYIENAIKAIEKENIQPVDFDIKKYAEQVFGWDRNRPEHRPQSFMVGLDHKYIDSLSGSRLKEPGIVTSIKLDKMYSIIIDGNHRAAKNYLDGEDTMKIYIIPHNLLKKYRIT